MNAELSSDISFYSMVILFIIIIILGIIIRSKYSHPKKYNELIPDRRIPALIITFLALANIIDSHTLKETIDLVKTIFAVITVIYLVCMYFQLYSKIINLLKEKDKS